MAAIGRMIETITIKSHTFTSDSEGFMTETDSVVHSNIRAYREGRHGSEAWRNRASFTTATDLFIIRDPGSPVIKTDMLLFCGESKFEIKSVENVKGRGMYLEILVEEVVPSGTR